MNEKLRCIGFNRTADETADHTLIRDYAQLPFNEADMTIRKFKIKLTSPVNFDYQSIDNHPVCKSCSMRSPGDGALPRSGVECYWFSPNSKAQEDGTFPLDATVAIYEYALDGDYNGLCGFSVKVRDEKLNASIR